MKTVMVVDDQPNIRQLVEIALKKADRRIISIESGERAIEVAVSEPPDLIIMDVMMPGGMDGFQAIEILKSNPLTCACPVLIITAKSQAAERRRSEQLGAEGYLAKPFKLNSLIDHVERLLN